MSMYNLFRNMPRRDAWKLFLALPHDRETVHDFRRSEHNRDRYSGPDPLAVPLLFAWRTFSDDNGETGTDFRLLRDYPDDPWTDNEIREYIEDSPVYCGRISSPYDCTGQRFTRWISFSRTPAGIALFHHWGTDI